MHINIRKILLFIAILLLMGSGLIFFRYQSDISKAYDRVSGNGTHIDTDCGPIEYTEFGKGPPVLMVHGAGGGYDQGKYFASIIDTNYRWIAPSRFGFLGSPVPEGADSSMQADAYACLLDALKIEEVGVVGVSMGGPSSILFAAQYPERTRSLALISAASHANPPRPGPIATLFKVFLNDFIFWSLVKTTPSTLLMTLGVPVEVQNQLPAEETAELHAFLNSIVPMGARIQGQMLEQHMSEYNTDVLQTIDVPTLIIHAKDDTLVFMEQAEFAAKNIPQAQLIPMEKGGHLALMFSFNKEATSRLQDFLKEYNTE